LKPATLLGNQNPDSMFPTMRLLTRIAQSGP